MVELVLAYTGTMLIGFEFIRKIKNLQAMLVLIAAWPFSAFINAFPFTEHERKIFKSQQFALNFKFIFEMIYGILFILLWIPLTLIFSAINLVIDLINAFNKILNIFYRNAIERFRPFSMKLARMIIKKYKRYEGISVEEVIKNIKETEIPFPPIVGVTLITIAFIMQII